MLKQMHHPKLLNTRVQFAMSGGRNSSMIDGIQESKKFCRDDSALAGLLGLVSYYYKEMVFSEGIQALTPL